MKIETSPFITKENKSFKKASKLKILFYLIKKDKDKMLLKNYKKRFFNNFFNLFKSFFKNNHFHLKDNLYLHNLKSFDQIESEIRSKENTFVFGFSYCQKPLSCPQKRFSDICIFDNQNENCKNCIIGKCKKTLNKEDILLIIPDISYISNKLFEISYKNTKKNIFFIITACPMSIEMFSFANILKIKGIGFPLEGRVCKNFKSFLFAEKGIKNSETYLSEKNETFLSKILDLRHIN